MKLALIIILVVITLLIAIGFFLFREDLTPYVAADKTDILPEDLKSYMDIINGTDLATDEFNIINLRRTYGRPDGSSNIDAHNLVLLSFFDETNGGYTKVLLNAHGDIIDTIHAPRRTSYTIDTYHLITDGYYTIEKNGFSGVKKYTDIASSITNADDIQQIYNESTYYRSFQYNDFDTTESEYTNKLKTYIFFHNNVWKKASIQSSLQPVEYLESKGENIIDKIDNTESQYNFTFDSETDPYTFENGYSAQLDYFEKKQYYAKRTAGMGSPTGQSKPAFWYGTGYYTLSNNDLKLLFMVEEDTLVKKDETYTKSIPRQHPQMTLSKDKNFDFFMLSISDYRSANEQLFLITTKN